MSALFLSLVLWLAGPQGGETVAGTVIHAETLRPFTQVRVELRREDYGRRLNTHEKPCRPVRDMEDAKFRRFVMTDEVGRFKFENVDRGRYYVLAEHEGYLKAEYGQRGSVFSRGAVLAVGPQAETSRLGMPSNLLQDLRLTLHPAPNIIGRIHGEEGARAPAGIVQLYQHRFTPHNGRTLVPVRSIFTDDNGEYRMFWLDPGQYVVSAAYSDYVVQPWTDGLRFSPNLPDSDNRYPTVFYPGVAKASEAVAIGVGGVVAPPMDVALWERKRFDVEIKLVGIPPPANTTVVLVPFGGDLCSAMDFGFAPKKDPGVIQIRDVPAGQYWVLAVSGRDALSELMPLAVVDRAIRDFRLPLVPPLDIPVLGLASDVTVNLHRAGSEVSRIQSFGPDAEGKIILKGVGPGSYYVTVDAPPGQYVRTIAAFRYIPENPATPCYDPPPNARAAGTNLYRYADPHGHLDKDNTLAIPSVIPGEVRCLRVTMAIGESLYGRVVDRVGTPVAGALVAGLPRSVWGSPDNKAAFTPADRYLSATTDSEGRYVLFGAIPGTEYKLHAFEDLDPNYLFDPTLLERFPNRDLIQIEETDTPDIRGQRRNPQQQTFRSVTVPGGPRGDWMQVSNSLCSPSVLCVLKVIPADETRSAR